MDIEGIEDTQRKDTIRICQSCTNPTVTEFSLTPFPLPSESSQHRNNNVTNLDKVVSNISIAEEETAKIDQEISRLQDTFNRLKGALEMLKKRKGEVDTYTANQKSLLAPIRKLPGDVLSYLFLVCQDVLDDGYITEKSVVHKLGHVSWYWHSIAQTSPRLWSRIGILKINNQSAWRSFMLKCITLSQETPLTIQAWLEDAKELGEEFVQALARSAHRMEHLPGEPSPELLQKFISYSPTALIALKSLTTSISDQYTTLPPMPNLTHLSLELFEVDTTFTVELQSLPSLTHFELFGRYHKRTFVNFPWHQITHFNIGSVYYRDGEISTILEGMSNLASLCVLYMGKLTILRRTILPTLTTLKLKRIDELENALGFLTAPRLRVLDVSDKFYVDTLAIQAIMAFLQRSRCGLNELILRNVYLGEEWDAKQFKDVTKLSLVLCDRTLVSPLLRQLNRTISGPGCLPRLEVLEILCDLHADELDDVMAVVKSRMPCDPEEVLGEWEQANLKEVHMYFWESTDLMEVEKWAQFVKANHIKSCYKLINSKEENQAYDVYQPFY